MLVTSRLLGKSPSTPLGAEVAVIGSYAGKSLPTEPTSEAPVKLLLPLDLFLLRKGRRVWLPIDFVFGRTAVAEAVSMK